MQTLPRGARRQRTRSIPTNPERSQAVLLLPKPGRSHAAHKATHRRDRLIRNQGDHSSLRDHLKLLPRSNVALLSHVLWNDHLILRGNLSPSHTRVSTLLARNPIGLIDRSYRKTAVSIRQEVTTAPRNGRAFQRFSHQHMPSDPISPIRVAVLSAALTFEPRPADPFSLRVLPVRLVMPRSAPQPDGDVPYFRYRIDRDGLVHTLPALSGARVCREKSPRRRRRSAARS